MADQFDKFMSCYADNNRTISKNVRRVMRNEQSEEVPTEIINLRNSKRHRLRVDETPKVPMGFRVDEELMREFKTTAIINNKTYTDFIEEAMRLVIDKYSK